MALFRGHLRNLGLLISRLLDNLWLRLRGILGGGAVGGLDRAELDLGLLYRIGSGNSLRGIVLG